jgi:tetratricopeptide (TPR) repeat protein
VKKQQLILVSGGFILLILLFFFGNTIPPKKPGAPVAAANNAAKPVEINQLLTHAKERLSPQQLERVNAIENSISRGDVKNQQMQVYKQLASFWADSIHLFEPYAYYTAEAAKLENSEKSLTFAAHLFLNNLKTEGDPAMQTWLASNAKVLFEQALSINPANDSSRIGLGACYIFGNLSENPMEGITPIRDIVAKNPDNTFGQFILGLGGIKSGQYDKAIERFLFVVKKVPDNLEATLNLAEAYERKGDKANAVKWYTVVKDKIPNAEARAELDKRIKALK